MLLEKLSLQNIRSYTQEEIVFPQGITLLAGDIGAGKSTVLYAVEFALFGSRRGDLSGDSLLRHGEQEGNVVLECSINGQSVVIQRSLKRSSSGVRQEAGTISIDGIDEELTALELRARVFELLGYPHELVSKAKDVMYRYTVYTPQEEMKRILTDSASHRLDVLRSVFGIDTYKTVQENLSSVIKEIRDEQRFLQGAIDDLSELRDQAKTLRTQQGELQGNLRELNKQQQDSKEVLEKKQAALKELEDAHEKYQQQRLKKQQHESKLESLQQKQQALTKEIANIQSTLKEELNQVKNPSEMRNKIETLSQKNTSAQATARTHIRRIQQQIKELGDDERSISKLTNCPTCKQEVGSEHKQHLKDHAQDKISELKEELESHQETLEKTQQNLQKIARHKQSMQQQEQAYQAYQRKKQTREDLSKRKESLSLQLEDVTEQLSELSDKTLEVTEFDTEKFKEHKQAVNEAQNLYQEHTTALKVAKTKLESIQDQHESLEKKISKRVEQQQRLQILQNQEQWLKDVFDKSVSEIERQVFASIHQEFSTQFSKLTHELLEEAGIFAQLDATFSPVITQDGFDADISTLSGGERQSISLAYRLALNQTINSLVDTLTTNGLLILDEPTDGFSGEQLSKVRDVIRSAEFSQLLIVSHEPRVHSFVDHVITVRKSSQTSEIL